MPRFIPPCLATLHQSVPQGDRWIHDLKFDGYRAQAHVNAKQPTIFTRSGLDLTSKFTSIAADLAKLKAKSAIIDGEIVAQDEQGRPRFSLLQAALKDDRAEAMLLYAFDLMELDGEDLRRQPLIERKRLLKALLGKPRKSSHVLYSEHFPAGDGQSMFDQACSLELEGIISKRPTPPTAPAAAKTG
jgi:bifunctional non-homologous end joining protein LigD